MRRTSAVVVLALLVTTCRDAPGPLEVEAGRPLPALSITPSGTGASLVFGPEQLFAAGDDDDDDDAETQVRQFSIAGFGGPFTLFVQNGDGEGGFRVSSARVILNGKTILQDDDDDGEDDDDGDDEDDDGDEDDDDGDEHDDDGDDDDDGAGEAGNDLHAVEVELTEPSVLEVRAPGSPGPS